MNLVNRSLVSLLALAAAGLAGTAAAAAAQKTILIGEQCDRTGATQITGVALCPAVKDYIDLIDSEGGIDGWTIKVDEIDNQYKVPLAVEAFERQKQEGAVVMMPYGTPMIEALYTKLDDDAGLRHRRGGEWGALLLCLSGCGDLLVAGRGCGQVREGPSGRQPQRQEDRVYLLRQSGRP